MKILISSRSFGIDESAIETIKKAGLTVVLNQYKRKLTEDELVELLDEDVVGIIAGTEKITERVLRKGKSLQVISRYGVGLDNIDLEAAARSGITVCSSPDAPTQSVAELTIAFILNLLRQVNLMDKRVRSGTWSRELGRLLSGKTVGIVGLGHIGKRVTELLRPFGVNILASELKPDEKWVEDNKVRLTSLEELLGESDIVTLHIPYTEQNRNLINAERIKIMKKGAILINTSRGGLVDEDALHRALKNGHLGGAALDTMEIEPYEGPLKELDNVILTPHIGSYALETRMQMEMEAAKNLINTLTERKK